MSNIRMVYDNVADYATLSASSTADGLVVDNLKTNIKGHAHRSIGTSVTYTASWGAAVTVGAVALPASNLSGSATIRVRLYNGLTLLVDSGTVYACPGATLESWDWSFPLNANAFIFGGVSKSAVWFSEHYSVTSCIVDLVDTTNAIGYIDCSRLVVGAYWEPKYNVSNSVVLDIVDTSDTLRNDAGDLLSNRGTIHDQISFDFSVLVESDKLKLTQILKTIGSHKNILVSVYPDSNSTLEQEHLIYGKRTNSSINTILHGIYSHAMEIVGW